MDKYEEVTQYLEGFLSDRLSITEDGKGHWAECIQEIDKALREAAAEAYDDAAKIADSITSSHAAVWKLRSKFEDKAASLRREPVGS